MPSRRQPKAALDRRARLILACFALAFLAGQAAFRLALAWRPAIGDPEFGRKLDSLRAKVADGPDRPLVVMLGKAEGEVEIKLPGKFAVSAAIAGSLKAVEGVVAVEHL